MSTYGNIYPYMQAKYTQIMQEIALQCIHSQETDMLCTKLILLQCKKTKLLYRGLQHQPSYFTT